jgi:hypothetical protein
MRENCCGQGQGDQIGRIFTYRATVFLVQFLKNTQVAKNLGPRFSTVKVE